MPNRTPSRVSSEFESASVSACIAPTPDPIALHRLVDELAREGITHLAIEASSQVRHADHQPTFTAMLPWTAGNVIL